MAPFWLPKCLPFGTLLALKIDQKIDRKSECLKGRSKIAPRAPKSAQDPPKTPPGPLPESPGTPQEASWTPPDAPRSPPGAPGRSKMFSEASGPITLFGKIKNFELVEKSRKKVDNGHPQWSPAPVLTKTESTFTTVGTQRVAAVVARSALQSAAPSAARRVVYPS